MVDGLRRTFGGLTQEAEDRPADRPGEREVSYVRGQLDGLRRPDTGPLDGAGTRILEIDDGGGHAEKVRDRLTGDGSISPQAKVDSLPVPPETTSAVDPNRYTEPIPDSREELDRRIDRSATALLDHVSGALEEVHRSGKLPEVVNISIGWSRAAMYWSYDQLLDQKGQDGNYLHPAMRKAVYGANADRLTREQMQRRVQEYVDGRLDARDSAFSQSSQRYQDVVAKFWEAGVPVVTAAGNFAPALEDSPYPAGSELNLLSQGKALSVGASNSNGTPADRRDDTIAAFSSGGNGQRNPTLAASGEEVIIQGETRNGTSYAAPLVASTIALIKQANPGLSSAQIVDILTSTATDTAADARREGAGILDPAAAVQRALEMRSRQS